MARKPMSEEERKAASERMKAMHAAKKAAQSTQTSSPQTNNQNTETPTTVTSEVNDPSVAQLTAMVKELMERDKQNQAFINGLAQGQNLSQGAQVSGDRVVGIKEKYSLDMNRYEDPRDRLLSEPRLQRIAFGNNYELIWVKEKTRPYETKSGIIMQEPEFRLQVVQIVLDDMGEATDKRIFRWQRVFHEDPSTALYIAEQTGYPVAETDEAKFLNDMRYLQVRDWVFEKMGWGGKPDEGQQNMQDEVIGGQLVQVYTKSSEQPGSIPFDQMNTKLRA